MSAALECPAYFRYDGPWVGGQKEKVVNVVPALSVEVTPGVAVVPLSTAGSKHEFRVKVLSNAKRAAPASVRLEAPEGWSVEPTEAPLGFQAEGEQLTVRFFVTAPAGVEQGDFELRAVAAQGSQEFREGYQVIAYNHTQERHLFHPAASQIKTLDVAINADASIGYVMGAGDEVPAAIEMLGYDLTFLTPDDLAFGDLSKYSTIMTGIRAYQTRKDLKAHHQRLMEYAKAGGHLVIQYNKFEFNQLAESRAAQGAWEPARPRQSAPTPRIRPR